MMRMVNIGGVGLVRTVTNKELKVYENAYDIGEMPGIWIPKLIEK
jgi:hypothetical protein